MVILIDTNIILDVLQKREEFYEMSHKVLTLCSLRKVKGMIAFHSVSNIFFILRKKYSEEERRRLLYGILKVLEVTGAKHELVLSALQHSEFRDFEDCLQMQCAKEVQADYIITRNVKDFKHSSIQAVTPEEFYTIYNQ